MANALCWQLLSEQERTSCIGQARSLNCCSQNVWDVTGALQLDWNSRVQPLINNLIIQNYKQVFGKRGVHAALAFHLFLLSATEDPSTAKPTILILTTDKKAASRAKKLLLRHEIYKSLNTGFDIHFESKPILFRAGEINDMDKSRWTLGSASLCGAPVVVAPSPLSFGSRLRFATVFCGICIEGQSFAMLPAHVFYPEPESEKPEVDTPSDTSSPPSDFGDSDLSQSEISVDSGFYSSSLTPHQENLGLDIASNNEIPLRHDVYILVQPKPVLLGHLEPAQELPSGKPILSTCRDLDFALVAIKNPKLIRPNQVNIPGKGIVALDQWKSEASDSPALVISSSSGAQAVHMSGTEVIMMFPWSSRPQRVWHLVYDLPSGDSGSLVVSPTGEIIGMAIASAPELNITYVMPAIDIFEIMWHSCEDSASPTAANDRPVSQQELFQPSTTISRPPDQVALSEEAAAIHHTAESKDDSDGETRYDIVNNIGGIDASSSKLQTPGVQTASRQDQWLPEEDEALARFVYIYGPKNWLRVSKGIPHKSPQQCKERYAQEQKLSSKAHYVPIEEDKAIECLVNEMEAKYNEIAERLERYSTTAVSHWYSKRAQQTQSQQQCSDFQHQSGVCWICDKYGNHANSIDEMATPTSSTIYPTGRSRFESNVLHMAVLDHSRTNLTSSDSMSPTQDQPDLQAATTVPSPRSPSSPHEDETALYSTSVRKAGSAVPLRQISPSRFSVDSGYDSIRDSMISLSGVDSDRFAMLPPSIPSKVGQLFSAATRGSLWERRNDKNSGHAKEGKPEKVAMQPVIPIRRQHAMPLRPSLPESVSVLPKTRNQSSFADILPVSSITTTTAETIEEAKSRKQSSESKARTPERPNITASQNITTVHAIQVDSDQDMSSSALSTGEIYSESDNDNQSYLLSPRKTNEDKDYGYENVRTEKLPKELNTTSNTSQKWQTELAHECQRRGYAPAMYNIVSDRRGGRTAWSATVTINEQNIAARYWYDVQYLNHAREDAAEVACTKLRAGVRNVVSKKSRGFMT